MNHQVGDERRREPGASSNAGENPAIGNATLAYRNPSCDELIRCRINDCFASAKKETNGDKQQECASCTGGNERRQGGEDAPPENAPGQYASWTVAVREVATERLKKSVTSHQCAEHLPELHISEMVGIDDGS